MPCCAWFEMLSQPKRALSQRRDDCTKEPPGCDQLLKSHTGTEEHCSPGAPLKRTVQQPADAGHCSAVKPAGAGGGGEGHGEGEGEGEGGGAVGGGGGTGGKHGEEGMAADVGEGAKGGTEAGGRTAWQLDASKREASMPLVVTLRHARSRRLRRASRHRLLGSPAGSSHRCTCDCASSSSLLSHRCRGRAM